MARDKTLISEAALSKFFGDHPQWKKVGEEIARTYEFPAFLTGIAFVQKVAGLAETADHHPDIDIRWRKVTLKLLTHDAGGLTTRDTELAAQCDLQAA